MAEPRKPESGFALLLIFCLAAIVGVMLYAATPRVAFEAQRDQEQLLIDRGEQYRRAIQLYFRALHRYPARLEDLENTANQRFLRRRYDDPISGKSEWRLIHVGPGGVLVDSVNKPAPKPGKEGGSVNNFITELQGLGTAVPGAGAAEGPGLRRRPSDQPGAAGNGTPLDPNVIAEAAGAGVAPTVPPGFGPQGAIPQSIVPQTLPGPIGPDGKPLPNNAYYTGYPNPNGAYAAANPLAPPQASPGQPSVPPAPPGNNQAAQMIQRLLTSPRPGGFPGQPPVSPDQFGNAPQPPGGAVPGSPVPSNGPAAFAPGAGAQFGPGMVAPTGAGGFNALQQPGQIVGGGIAGVASTVERQGIKVYHEKNKYNEWEFLYDYAQEAGAAQVRGAVPGGANPAAPGVNSGGISGNAAFGNLPQQGAPPPIKP